MDVRSTGNSIEKNVVNMFNTSVAASVLSKLSTFTLSMQPVNMPEVKTNKIVHMLLDVQSLMFLMDYIFRVVVSARHIKSFCRNGVVIMPTIDLRASRSTAMTKLSSYSNKLIFMMELVPFLWMEALVVAIFIIFIIFVVQGNSSAAEHIFNFF
jgi:hypothetical protein